MDDTKQTALVKKANSLVEASFKLSALEQKVILTLASQIRQNDSEFKTYTLSIKEFCETLGVKGTSKYTELRRITLNLMKKAFQVQLEKRVVQVSWLSYVSYNENQGTVDMQFAPFLKPYLLELKRNFTSYPLSNVVKLKRSYSIRMYELLKQYQRIGERTFTLDELLQKLGLENSSYTAYSNLKLKVLKPAQKELAEKTDLSFDIIEIKKSRKVESVRFVIRSKEKLIVPSPAVETKTERGFEEVQDVLKGLSLTVSDEIISGWLKHHTAVYITDIPTFAMTEGSIQNPLGFATYAIKHNLQIEHLKHTVREGKQTTRTEILPEWFQKGEQTAEQGFSDDTADLIEQRKRLEEELQKYRKTKSPAI